MNPHTHFSTLVHYNVWATQRLLQAIEPVVEADYRRNLGLFFKSIHGTLNHLLVGEHLLWYPRFARGASPKAGSALTHVFNHGTHHRGQISAALTPLGQPAPELDLANFFQQKALS